MAMTGPSRSSNFEPLPRGPRLAEGSVMRTVATSLITIALLAGVIQAGDQFPVKKVLILETAMKAASHNMRNAGSRLVQCPA